MNTQETVRGLGSVVAVRVCFGENFMCKTNCSIETVLKNIRINIQLENYDNDKWLVWDVNEWVVYERKQYARKTTIVIRTNSIKKTVEKLTED